ncbi:MAG: hypothetical protein ACLQVY_12455 [Limisphaerales bacterium]
MKQRNKLTNKEQEQTETGQLQAGKESVLEFKSAEDLLRHDAGQVSVPPAVAVRLHESISNLPSPRRGSWWKRFFR